MLLIFKWVRLQQFWFLKGVLTPQEPITPATPYKSHGHVYQDVYMLIPSVDISDGPH